MLTPSIGHLDDLSPGDGNMNGSKSTFTSYTDTHYNNSIQSLSNSTNLRANITQKSVYPYNSKSSQLSSSSSWSSKPTSHQDQNGHLTIDKTGKSTTSYLLSGKPNLAPKPQFQSHFSKSIPNVSNFGFDLPNQRVSNGSNKVDLLGSIETDSWESSNSHGQYQASTYNSSSLNNRASNYFDYYSSNCIYSFIILFLFVIISLVPSV